MTGVIVTPQAGWAMPPVDGEERDEEISPRQARYMTRMRERTELQCVLGVLVYGATILPRVGVGPLGPAYGPDGYALTWTIWAPHRSVLINVFRRLPPQEELDARTAFAATHGLHYAVVEPGFQLTAKSVKEWLDERQHRSS